MARGGGGERKIGTGIESTAYPSTWGTTRREETEAVETLRRVVGRDVAPRVCGPTLNPYMTETGPTSNIDPEFCFLRSDMLLSPFGMF
jgi:hypothetical protein